MTWQELLHIGTDVLDISGDAEAANDARQILFSVCGMDLTSYAARGREEAPKKETEAYISRVRRREEHEPLQYILGYAPFYGRDFAVRKGVLIPRFDTETLIAEVLPSLESGMKILDLCTGSGCILLTLLLEGPRGLHGAGTDISDEALLCARENADRFESALREKESSAEILKSDLFASITETYDIIVSNPPYVRRCVMPDLDAEVRDYEPRLALDGGADGLDFYKKIVPEAERHLRAGGLLALEIGSDEAEDVRKLMKDCHFSEIRIARDLGGLDRVVLGVRDR